MTLSGYPPCPKCPDGSIVYSGQGKYRCSRCGAEFSYADYAPIRERWEHRTEAALADREQPQQGRLV